ncbi:MAG TPA: AsnC family transcriptional regulator [Candidatus Thermoplasmatota archaeon]|nr:AsnC family transcriptional regulator [Candidatus Thermoplasmatota archaeon]
MDALDMRLLRAMGTTPFAYGARSLDAIKPARLAERVGTTRQTVEARLARLSELGVLQGYQVWPNLRHLGLTWEIHHWKVPDPARKASAYGSLPLADGIVAVFSFLGPDLCVAIQSRNPEDRARTLARVTEAVGGGRPATLWAREMPPVREPLTTLDWRILAALRHDARRPLEGVAREAGVSVRTVKRRVARMTAERAFDVTANVALERSPYPIPFAFLFHFTPEGGRATAAALLDLFDDRTIAAWVPWSASLGHYDMSLYARTPGEVEEMRDRALKVPGVAEVETLLYTGARVESDWLDRAMAERLGR